MLPFRQNKNEGGRASQRRDAEVTNSTGGGWGFGLCMGMALLYLTYARARETVHANGVNGKRDEDPSHKL